jgi:hypothetical protein
MLDLKKYYLCYHTNIILQNVFLLSIWHFKIHNSSTYATVMFQKIRHKLNSAQVRIEYTYGQIYTYTQGSLV